MWNQRLGVVLIFIGLTATTSITAAEESPTAPTEAELVRTIEVPVDRDDPALGTTFIHAELGAPFDPQKPVLFVIADAQQFYVRRGSVAKLQEERFGNAFNVVGILTRGSQPELLEAALGPDGKPDWEKAWAIFAADEWVEDIEAVRRAVVGPEGTILLYGQSGGAFLVHQYLAEHGRHVARAATPAALNPFIVGELGLGSDRFWQEVGAHDPGLHALLRQALQKDPSDRERLIMTLQRQNFFVSPDELAEARARLIRALAAGETAVYEKAREDYQVEAVRSFLSSPRGIPIRVRLYEFFLPSGAGTRLAEAGDRLYPDLENQRNLAAPLLELHDKARIPAPSWDRGALHQLNTEVLVLAGVQDHTVDYRSSVALAFLYPRGHLFLADDDHQFHRLADGDRLYPLLQSFLAFGAESSEFRKALSAAEPYRWREP